MTKDYTIDRSPISLVDFYGKSNVFAIQIYGNYFNADIRAIALSVRWNGTSKIQCTIDVNAVITSSDTITPSCYAVGSFPNGLLLINNGKIIGKGGNGGTNYGGFWSPGDPGFNGGTGLFLETAQTTILNNGIIAGGGGGGGACGSPSSDASYFAQSGGGGGGAGYGLGGQTGASLWGANGTLTNGGSGGIGYDGHNGGGGGNLGLSGGAGGQGANGGALGGAGGYPGNSIDGGTRIISWGPNGPGLIYGTVAG